VQHWNLHSIDAVIGLDFMIQKKKNMTLICTPERDLSFPATDGRNYVQAYQSQDELRDCDSYVIESCTMSANAINTIPDDELAQAFIACVSPELRAVDAASGLHHHYSPEVKDLLSEGSDVHNRLPRQFPPQTLHRCQLRELFLRWDIGCALCSRWLVTSATS
jgi:hypothetical protein